MISYRKRLLKKSFTCGNFKYSLESARNYPNYIGQLLRNFYLVSLTIVKELLFNMSLQRNNVSNEEKVKK